MFAFFGKTNELTSFYCSLLANIDIEIQKEMYILSGKPVLVNDDLMVISEAGEKSSVFTFEWNTESSWTGLNDLIKSGKIIDFIKINGDDCNHFFNSFPSESFFAVRKFKDFDLFLIYNGTNAVSWIYGDDSKNSICFFPSSKQPMLKQCLLDTIKLPGCKDIFQKNGLSLDKIIYKHDLGTFLVGTIVGNDIKALIFKRKIFEEI